MQLGLQTWKIPGDLGAEPEKTRVWGRGRSSIGCDSSSLKTCKNVHIEVADESLGYKYVHDPEKQRLALPIYHTMCV